ncbi:MAG: RES family NAD+ phosphorylase, partial [Spirochaetales bacterium]|nr:RES family NAD+ phosphorylase [Spirochaetales bacterium]
IDLSGDGARLHGGRWNKKGTSLLYTSESRSLAAVEYLVHIPLSIIPRGICIARIELPRGTALHTIEEKDLPANWRMYPAPLRLAEMTEDLLKKKKVFAIRVPSAVVDGEWNVLLNPQHKNFGGIEIRDVREFRFDERLLKKKQG